LNKSCGDPLYGIARELDRRGMRGGKWHPATVKLLLARSS